ncbi:MAG: hypothetical protein ACYC6F_02855 [Longimicrobiales bacterium]
MMNHIKMVACLGVLLAAACVSVNKSVLTPGLAPVPLGDVHVYFESDSIPEHTRVAILNAQGSSGFTNEGQMIDKLREEAAKLGANAIILSGMKEPGAGEKFVNYLAGGFADGQRKGGAIAIWVPSLAKPPGEDAP